MLLTKDEFPKYSKSSYSLISKNNPVEKKWPEDISAKKTYNGQQAHEKMLDIANYEGNANPYYNVVSPHTNQNSGD